MEAELKELKESFKKSVDDAQVKSNEEQKKRDEEFKKELDLVKEELKEAKASSVRPNIFGIGGKYPSRVDICGKRYNLKEQGASLNEKAYGSKSKFNFLGKDCKENYLFTKWMTVMGNVLRDKTNPEYRDELKAISVELKASEMVEGTTTLGGFGVPDEFQTELVLLVREDSHALQECNTSITMNTDTLYMPSETSGFTAYWPGEATAPTESNAVQGQITLSAKKMAVLTDGVSNELIADSGFDLVSYISEACAYAKAQELDNQVLKGAASPWGGNIGLFTAGITNSRTITGSTPTVFAGLTDEDISYAIQGLSVKDSANGKLVIGKLIGHQIRTLKDSSGSPIFVAPSAPTVPGTVYGYPYQIWNQAEVADGASTVFGVFGDLKQFFVARRQGQMSLDSDPYSEFDKDMTRFRMNTRWGMAIRRASAFYKLTTGA